MNTIQINSDNGLTEVFLSDLDVMVDEIIRDLDDDTLSKPTTFMYILKEIYVRKFRPTESLRHNSKSLLMNTDPEVILHLWDWYCRLACKYGRTPTVLQFCILTGFDRHTFQDWREGNTRKASPEYSTVAKKIKQDAEGHLESKAYESNSVSAIFGLKASHGWRETAPVIPELDNSQTTETAQQISARYLAEARRMPDKPDLTELDALVTGGEHDD